MRPAISLLFLVAVATSAPAQEKKEPLVTQVKSAIDKGVRYMRSIQSADGSWEKDQLSLSAPGGMTALALLALLNSGVPADDPSVAKGLTYLRKLDPAMTYARALQTMVFAEVGKTEDRQRIQDNVQWLIDARIFNNAGQLVGWNYTKNREILGGVERVDNSNTQYALLGLWAGRQAGVNIKREVWESIREFYQRTQQDDGRWVYSRGQGTAELNRASLTMTSAGLCSLLIAGMELNVGREVIGADGVAANCGIYKENPTTAKAMGWIGKNFTLDGTLGRIFYNLYGIERTGRLTGQRFLGGHDWYREGCKYLVDEQHPDGSWSGKSMFDGWPAVSTSFALLFLSKGRTPILMSKLAHGVPTQRDADTDWNNDRNDLRNLVDFSAKELFSRLPLGWQTFDIMRSLAPKGATTTEEDELEATAELLQSPIAYINGHRSPRGRFTGIEKKILQRYIENGGFILAEACCGRPEFDLGFKELAEELWPDNSLTELDADHAVWKSHFLIAPGSPYKLWGIALGCKTVLIYSPQDLSCRWESNDTKDGASLRAFQLGANIVAYATGREPPKPRLTHVDVASGKEQRTIERGYLKVAQIKHSGDWQPAPKAMRNLLDKLNKTAGLDVSLKTEEISVASPSIVDFKFLYMNGRRDFRFDDEALTKLRFNLDNGGLLFADASCGKESFDKAFRAFAKQLFPKEKLTRVPLEDMLFGKALNGTALTDANIQLRFQAGEPMKSTAPYLEGVKHQGRWVILYSKYDVGCALERHQSVDCPGYHPDSAAKIAGAALLYSLQP